MTEPGRPSKISRILVALESDGRRDVALETAVKMAEEFEAELVGLFVSGADFFNLVSLPGATRLIGRIPGEQVIDRGSLERAMRVLIEQARADFTAAVEGRRLRWSFKTASGPPDEVLISEASGFDVIAFGRGMTARRTTATVTSARCSLLLAKPEPKFGRPVVMWFDGNEEALATAVKLARGSQVNLVIVAASTTSERQLSELQRKIGKTGPEADIRHLRSAKLSDILTELRLARPGFLIVDRSSPLLESNEFQDFVDDVGCPVLLTA